MSAKKKPLYIDAISTRDVYRGICGDLCTLTENIALDIQSAFFRLSLIEEFVEDVLSSKELAFSVRKSNGMFRLTGRNYSAEALRMPGYVIEPLALAKHFRLFHLFLLQYETYPSDVGDKYRVRNNTEGRNEFLSDEYIFSKYVSLFFNGCMRLELHANQLLYDKPNSPIGSDKFAADVFNDLIQKIREGAKVPGFKSAHNKQADAARRAYSSIEDYLDALFRQHHKLVVLRIDLIVGRENAESAGEREAGLQLKAFLNKKRGKIAIFEDLVGYVWKFDWDEQRGHFYHFIFLFQDARRHTDEALAMLIGEYWCLDKRKKSDPLLSVPRNYFLCGNNLNEFKNAGSGLVKQNDRRRNDLLKAISFLTMKNLYLTVQYGHKSRLIHHGEVNKSDHKPSRRLAMPRKPRM